MNIKKIVVAVLLLNSFVFAQNLVGIVGVFSGSAKKNFDVTVVDSSTAQFSDESSALFATLRLGAYLTEDSRLYVETYQFGDLEADEEITNMNSVNFDYLGSIGALKPFIGLNYIYQTYEHTQSSTKVISDSKMLGGRLGLVLNIGSLGLEVGMLKHLHVSSEESTTATGGTTETVTYEPNDETWFYFGAEMRFSL